MVAVANLCAINTYEEARKQRLEENKRKFQDLGISSISKTLSNLTTPEKKTQQRVSKPKSENDCLAVEPRRSSRQRNPVQSYVDDVDIGLPTMRKRSRSSSSSFGSYLARPLEECKIATDEERNAAFEAAETLQENLQSENPSFVKSMVRSHVYSCFWLGLPSKFCEDHLSKTGSDLVLEDEDGNEYETVYIGKRTGLSGGWRGFALEHKLDDGDALVFELTEPTRFKIYIVKASPFSSRECRKNVADKEKNTTSAENTSKAAMTPDPESNQKRRSKIGIVPAVEDSKSSLELLPESPKKTSKATLKPDPGSNQKRRSKRGIVPEMEDLKSSLELPPGSPKKTSKAAMKPDPESKQKRRSKRGILPEVEDTKISPELPPESPKKASMAAMKPDPESNQKRRSKRGIVLEVEDSKSSPELPPESPKKTAMAAMKPDPESNQRRRSKRGIVLEVEDSKSSPELPPESHKKTSKAAMKPDPESNQKRRSMRGIVLEVEDSKSSPELPPESPKNTSKAAMKPDPESNQKRRSMRGIVSVVEDSELPQESPKKTSKAAMKPDPESNQKRRSKRGIVSEGEDSKSSPNIPPESPKKTSRAAIKPDPESNQKRKSKRDTVHEVEDSKISPKFPPESPKSSEIQQEASLTKVNEVVPKKLGTKTKANRARDTQSSEGCEVQQVASATEEDSRAVKQKECVAKKPRKERLFRKRA